MSAQSFFPHLLIIIVSAICSSNGCGLRRDAEYSHDAKLEALTHLHERASSHAQLIIQEARLSNDGMLFPHEEEHVVINIAFQRFKSVDPSPAYAIVLLDGWWKSHAWYPVYELGVINASRSRWKQRTGVDLLLISHLATSGEYHDVKVKATELLATEEPHRALAIATELYNNSMLMTFPPIFGRRSRSSVARILLDLDHEVPKECWDVWEVSAAVGAGLTAHEHYGESRVDILHEVGVSFNRRMASLISARKWEELAEIAKRRDEELKLIYRTLLKEKASGTLGIE